MTAREINLDNYERRYSVLVKEYLEPKLDTFDYPAVVVTNYFGEPTNVIYIDSPIIDVQGYALRTYYRKKATK